jgi:hypothetical protein
MLDDKTVQVFGNFIALEHKFCYSPLNYDSSHCLMHHNKASLWQRLGFFLNLLQMFSYFVFEAGSLIFISLDNNPKPSDIFWLSLYALCYIWSFLTALDVWFLRKDIVYAFNCLVTFSRKILLGKISSSYRRITLNIRITVYLLSVWFCRKDPWIWNKARFIQLVVRNHCIF